MDNKAGFYFFDMQRWLSGQVSVAMQCSSWTSWFAPVNCCILL